MPTGDVIAPVDPTPQNVVMAAAFRRAAVMATRTEFGGY